MSWLTNLRGVVGTLFKIGKADFDSTAVTTARTLTLRDVAGTVALLSDITTYGRSLQEITPTSEGQTAFTVPGGYAVGSTDFLVNGVQLRTTEFTATDGTTVTISAGLSTTDILTAIKWGNGGATSFTTTAISATNGQTAFTVPIYPTGLSAMAVYRNGIRLTPATDFVETNSTTVTLTSAADLNDDMLFISGTPVGSFGTMATQNANAVAITGGTATLSSGIVDANSSSAAVRITQTGSGSCLLVEDSASTDSTPFIIDAAGFVGIGTTTPFTPLMVKSDTSSAYASSSASADTPSGVFVVVENRFNSVANNASLIRINCSSGAGGGYLGFMSTSGVANSDGTFVLGRRTGTSAYSESLRVTSSARLLLNTTTDDGASQLQVSGHIAAVTAGNGLRIKEGSNAKQGTAVLVAGAVTVSNTSVTANSRIFLTSNTDGGTPGFVRVSARTAGTSFTITSSSATDTSTIAYEIFEPA